MLQQACRDAVGWPAHVRVSVKLSPLQFRSRTPVADVMGALAAAGLAPAGGIASLPTRRLG